MKRENYDQLHIVQYLRNPAGGGTISRKISEADMQLLPVGVASSLTAVAPQPRSRFEASATQSDCGRSWILVYLRLS